MDDDEEEVPAAADGSNIPLHEQSNDNKLNGHASSDLNTAPKSRIETAHAASDSS